MSRISKPRTSHSGLRSKQPIRGRLQLDRNGSTFLAPARVDLLEAIGEFGSITGAAKAVGVSYKAAWDAVDTMNSMARSALVSRSAGGHRGGGTQLTAYGKRVIACVRRIERDYADVLELLDEPDTELAYCNRMRDQLSVRSSARNQWIGRTTQVISGMVNAEVSIALGEQQLRASVTSASAQRLGITAGADVCVLVKATSIKLSVIEGTGPARASGNQMLATVAEIREGHEQLEITALMENERTITAVVPATSEAARIRQGARVVASFGPEQVLLVQLDPSF